MIEHIILVSWPIGKQGVWFCIPQRRTLCCVGFAVFALEQNIDVGRRVGRDEIGWRRRIELPVWCVKKCGIGVDTFGEKINGFLCCPMKNR